VRSLLGADDLSKLVVLTRQVSGTQGVLVERGLKPLDQQSERENGPVPGRGSARIGRRRQLSRSDHAASDRTQSRREQAGSRNPPYDTTASID
jgi:hypothetical protein